MHLYMQRERESRIFISWLVLGLQNILVSFYECYYQVRKAEMSIFEKSTLAKEHSSE